MASEYTLSYNQDSAPLTIDAQGKGGWPSFYSFFPEYMIGMNSYFYSFSGGNLFRHNTNESRNTYYGQFSPSTITSVFNPEPTLSIKLFKTLSYESNTTVVDTTQARWACTELATDITDGTPGGMLETYFEQKEGEWFSFIRTNAAVINWQMRSANGLGSATGVTVVGAATTIDFAVPTGSIISIGDGVYFVTLAGTPPTATGAPQLAGIVTAINANSIVIDNSTGVGTPAVGQFIMYIKNSTAESHGARGYFLQFKLENDSTSPVELFSVGSSVMKSNP